MRGAFLAISVCILFVSKLHSDGHEPSILRDFEGRLEALLSTGEDFNPDDAVKVQIDQCRITWRREFLSRQCAPKWSAPAVTKSIDLNDFKIRQRINDSMGVTLYSPLGEIRGGMGERLQVDVPIGSINQLRSQ